MSFIDYNFFPILFFLGWNILTTKQFRPPIYHTLDSKTLPALSIFSLNPINKSTLKTHLKHQKTSDILEFVPEFQFLSEKQKLIGMSSTNSFKKVSVLKNRLFQHRTKIEKKNRFSGFTNRFQNSFFLETEIDQKNLNSIKSIQKQRSKIRLVLKLRNQKLYSLNRFQIALCFSKILQPISQDMNNFSSGSMFSKFFPGYTDVSYFSSNFGDYAFTKPKHETADIYRYEQKKKNWYMKTQFFQQVSWNMNYKILDHFSNLESLCGTTSLPVKDIDNFVKKSFQTPILFSEKSTNAAWFEKPKTNSFLTAQKFWQNYFLKIYGGSWYYENLAFPNHNLNNRSNYQQSNFFTKFESDIGIYALAHKLSSIGFHNSSSDIDIYPFKYNDSYRYNFQNMNLSNQRLQYFLGLSSLNNHTRNSSLKLGGEPKNTNVDQDFSTTNRIGFSDFRKFLDFQNPISSKIYAPIFQPQGLNLLFFITNGFLNVVPNSTINSQSLSVFESSPEIGKTINFSKSNQLQPIIYNSSHDLKNSKQIDSFFKAMPMISESLHSKPKKFKMFNNFYHKLAINGIHSNFYPWITQNASERWSASNNLCSFLLDSSFLRSFSKIESNSLQANVSLSRHPSTHQLNTSTGGSLPFWYLPKRNTSWTTLKKKFIPVLQKQSLKNSYSQLYFTERPSCIKKPSIFFSSFRNLPYFFISEALSKKNVAFPQTNLSLFYQPIYNSDKFLNFPQDNLFQNNALKENHKKKTVHLNYLQQKSFNIRDLDTPNTNASHFKIRFKGKYLKPLSTFIKKEVGYETSLFSWALRANQKIKPHWFEKRQKNFQNYNSVIMNKDTWKVLPPLFQPLSFRFIDLNLPRTWSSEFFTSMFKDTRVKKKPLEFYPTSSHILSFFEQKKPKVKLQKKPNRLSESIKLYMAQKNFFRFSVPFYFSDFFHFSSYLINAKKHKVHSNTNEFDIRMLKSKNQSQINSTLSSNYNENDNYAEFYDGAFPLTDFTKVDEFAGSKTTFGVSKQKWNNKKKNLRLVFNETTKFPNSKIIVYREKPLLKNRTVNGPPLKNQKESISLPSYLKNITNQNYQNLCPNNLNELYVVFWILFNKTLFIYLSLHYLQKFISFLGTEYIRNLFKIFVTMKFIDGNILSIIKTFQDFNFQLNQQNIIDIKVNKQLKNIKRN